MKSSKLYSSIALFLNTHTIKKRDWLLALSGGCDSLYLFYALLEFRKHSGIGFHIAHVDHGWRSESEQEASLLHQMALEHDVPFHLIRLDPAMMKGNLELLCREARYAFFKQLCETLDLEGVITGHHRDDRSETTFKRIVEGSHWLKWGSMNSLCEWKGVRVLRPLLSFHKEQVLQEMKRLNKPFFSDPTNFDNYFLRSRLRECIFPSLELSFGKKIETSLFIVGNEMSDLLDYFNHKLSPFLKTSLSGPFGVFLDLQKVMLQHPVETKIIIRLFAEKEGCTFSREVIERAALGLAQNEANLHFAAGHKEMIIDRRCVFITTYQQKILKQNSVEDLQEGVGSFGEWNVSLSEVLFRAEERNSDWRIGWRGSAVGYLPLKPLQMISYDSLMNWKNATTIKKQWSRAKVPAFLYSLFPLIISEEEICHEFLSGRSRDIPKDGASLWRIEIKRTTLL